MNLVNDTRVVVPAPRDAGWSAAAGGAGAAPARSVPACPALLRPSRSRRAQGPVSLGRPVRVCVPMGRSHRWVRPGGARRLAGQERVGVVDRWLAGVAVVLASTAAVVVLGLLAELAAAR